jgi:hypothetical protein
MFVKLINPQFENSTIVALASHEYQMLSRVIINIVQVSNEAIFHKNFQYMLFPEFACSIYIAVFDCHLATGVWH